MCRLKCQSEAMLDELPSSSVSDQVTAQTVLLQLSPAPFSVLPQSNSDSFFVKVMFKGQSSWKANN